MRLWTSENTVCGARERRSGKRVQRRPKAPTAGRAAAEPPPTALWLEAVQKNAGHGLQACAVC